MRVLVITPLVVDEDGIGYFMAKMGVLEFPVIVGVIHRFRATVGKTVYLDGEFCMGTFHARYLHAL